MKKYLKKILPKIITPFLRTQIKQKRYVILHEVTKEQMSVYDQLSIDNTELIPTFDDGFYSSYEAIKNLNKQKAIFFVCPGFVDSVSHEKWAGFLTNNLLRTDIIDNIKVGELKPCSWENLAELVKLGHIIGSHTINHVNLARINSTKELEEEIIGSGDILEDKLNCKIEYFSWPYGNLASINERALMIIKKRYKHCFSGIRGNNQDQNQFILWRDHLDLNWSGDYLKFLLRGGLDWYYWGKRRALNRITLAE